MDSARAKGLKADVELPDIHVGLPTDSPSRPFGRLVDTIQHLCPEYSADEFD
jgi:hypothetical protein